MYVSYCSGKGVIPFATATTTDAVRTTASTTTGGGVLSTSMGTSTPSGTISTTGFSSAHTTNVGPAVTTSVVTKVLVGDGVGMRRESSARLPAAVVIGVCYLLHLY